jgi:DNA-binding response OmpR family regulator
MVALLLQDKFDLHVLDRQLPVENGISIAKRLKRSQPDLYIIMLTARKSEADQVRGFMFGVYAYLSKPTTPGCWTRSA